MSDFVFSIAVDESEFIEVEKGLYSSFYHDDWYKENWVLAGENRLRTKPTYDNLTVYLCKKEGKIVGASVMNWDRKGELQVEVLGFEVENKESESFCEGLAMFALDLSPDETLKFMTFFDFVIDDVKKRGVEMFYGSCSKELLPSHKMLGFEVLGETIVAGNVEYFVRINLNDVF